MAKRAIALGAISLAAVGMATSRLVEPHARAQSAPACDTPTTAFCSSTVPLPADWHGHIFALSQDYPSAAPKDSRPWLALDPRTQSLLYLTAVLGYFYDGNLQPNVEDSFDPKLNTKRHWYNAPWQDAPFDVNGREPIHGLTRERVSRAFELSPEQTKQWNNYAVGFYNAPGGVTLGQVWAKHGNPDPSKAANMPEGTVAAKLLFTTAPVTQVPYLQGAPEWDAYIYADPNDPNPKLNSRRDHIKVRLLQIDVAVKDSRVASTTGWVFGTFVYGGGPGGANGSGWKHIAPVGLMWGNDPGYAGTGPLVETKLNPAVRMPHVGYQGRLNGPVDNKISSCLSCHATAELPPGQMTPPANDSPARWFQNIPSGTPFDAGRLPLDYSLQFMVGIRAFQNNQQIMRATNATKRMLLTKRVMAIESLPARDGGQIQ